MSIKRILGLALILCALAAFAVPVSGLAADDTKDLSVYFRPAVRFGTDDRVLYIMDFLVPVYRGGNNIVFLNTKFTADNLDGWETNLGIGYRHLFLGDKLILGGNVFYDNRRTGSGDCWEQVGVGAEAMTEINKYLALTGRFNYYFSLTDPRVSGTGGAGGGYIFREGGIYSLGGGLVKEAPDGFDGELGVRIPFVSDYVETWVYGGGYHYHGDHIGSIDGWSTRLEVIPTDFLRINYEYRQDPTNHGEHYGEIALEVPFSIDNLLAGKNPFAGMGDMLKGSRGMAERMVEPVHRDVDIRVVSAGSGGGTGALVEGVVFVSDGAASGGDGSYENPYNTLAAALADSRIVAGTVTTIHVLADTASGITGTTLGSTGLTVWGAGVENPDYPGISNFVSGNSTITSTLTMNAINQTIMGLYFNVSGSSAITIGTGATGAGLTIADNRIDSTAGYGIYGYFNADFGTAGDPVVISGNTISIDSSSDAYGISLGNSTTGSIYASILNNEIDVDTSGTSANGIYLNANAGGSGGIGNVVSTISGNTITHSGTASASASGIYLFGRTSIAVSITNNTISNISSPNNAYGISLSGDGAVTGSVTGNTMTGISSIYRAYGMYARGSNLGTTSSHLVFTGNSGTITSGSASGDTALMLNLNLTGAAANSYLSIGTDTSGIGMGNNSFTGTPNWDGSYLNSGGPIYSNAIPSYIYNTSE